MDITSKVNTVKCPKNDKKVEKLFLKTLLENIEH